MASAVGATTRKIYQKNRLHTFLFFILGEKEMNERKNKKSGILRRPIMANKRWQLCSTAAAPAAMVSLFKIDII